MKCQDKYLLEERETFDDDTSLLDQYLLQENKKIQSEIDFILSFAEGEIKQLYDLHHLYSSESEFFPVIELGEIEEMDKKCTTN